MPLPNFLIIGTAKSGTTSLYHYLNQHPEVFMSRVKEPRYFIFQGKRVSENILDPLSLKNYRDFRSKSILKKSAYLSLFENAKQEKVLGEASVTYLHHPNAPYAIKQAIPEAKMVAIFRNPFDAIFSHYKQHKRMNLLANHGFTDCLKIELKNKHRSAFQRPFFINYRFYDEQLQRYLNTFLRNQFHLCLYEDLNKPKQLMKNIFRFLEINDGFQPDLSVKFNTTVFAKQNIAWSRIIEYAPKNWRTGLNCVLPAPLFEWYMKNRPGNRNGNQQTPSVKCPEEAKEILTPLLKDHILRFQDMIDRDCSHWLS